jgi:lipopolysaccharide/colanic/teichoic acid biosynthesis glycosyltransferase
MASRDTARVRDIIGAAIGIIITAPLVGLAMIAIRIEDGKPVIYRRRVVGRNTKQFDAFKLRTMHRNAEQWLVENPGYLETYQRFTKLEHDPRVTRVGSILRRTSIDELPQLINVLRGEMSLVGPRIIHPSETDHFGDFLAQRQSVRPGLTGLWQVQARNTLDYEVRKGVDQYYLEHRSFWLDARIIILTIPAVISGSGAR